MMAKRLVVGPQAFLAAMMALFVIVPAMRGTVVDQFSFYNAMQTFAALGLVALALGLTMILGEFDLSVAGTYALGAMVGVKTGQHGALAGVAVAVGVGALAGLAQGLIVSRLGIGSMSVTLAGLLILLGLTHQIAGGKTVAFDRVDVGLALDGQTLGILSPRSLIALTLCVLATILLRWTAVGRLLRAIGGDRRASISVGLPVRTVITLTFVASGALCALGGVLTAYSLATAQSDPDLSPLIFAVTAALIGGVTLDGGRGTALGIAAGAIGLSFLQGMFGVLASPFYITSLVTGGLLLIVVAIRAPGVHRWRERRRARAPVGTARV